MQEALRQIRERGTPVSDVEMEAAMAAALLHDVGHGPFSHTLEHDLMTGFRHEDMSRIIMKRLDERTSGRLDLTLRYFDDTAPRTFFHQLVSSQLDMDRLDYLRRDAFYTGVSEGVVGVNRIIRTLQVHPLDGGTGSSVVVQEKGAYAVEAFIIARRLMYWQVYLHKAVIAGDHLLRSAFNRARDLGDRAPDGSSDLMFFLRNRIDGSDIHNDKVVDHYVRMDDADVLFSLKEWSSGADPILSDLSRRFLNRDFIRVRFLDDDPSDEDMETIRRETLEWMHERGLADDSVADPVGYYCGSARSSHSAYQRQEAPIAILDKSDRLWDLSDIADTSAIEALSRPVTKPYVFAPKEILPATPK